jgi:hypothetical protein
MFRSALRTTLGAGFMVAAMASASAQVLEIGMDNGPTGLDPHLITAFPSFMVVNGNIYEGLTTIDKDLKVIPSLAESWTVAPDGKTYTFKLRSGVKFHDGSPFEAADVVASVKRGYRLAAGQPPLGCRERQRGRCPDRRTEAEGAVRGAFELARHHRHRAALHGDQQGRAPEDAGRHGSVQVPGMATQRLHPA